MPGEDDMFRMFLRNWVMTQHPLKGRTPFPEYPYLKELTNPLFKQRLILFPKSRQMLISWLMCSAVLFRALHGGMHLLLSKNQFSADELLRRIKFIFDNLPRKLCLSSVSRNRSELDIKGHGRIVSLPATEDAPRMHSPTSVFWDEMAFTPKADRIWSALKPCLDNGAFFAGVSTPNGAEGIFYDLVKGAPDNGFYTANVHWKSHPERNSDWENSAKKGLSAVEWRREYEIAFEGAAGLVYPEFTGANILPGDYICNPSLPVFRTIDFGYRHPYALWIQELPDGKLIVFAEWPGEDSTVEDMIEEIRRIDTLHGISEKQVVFTSCDPAGDAVDSTGITPVQRLKKAGFKMRFRPSRILTGVELLKSLLMDANGEAKLFFSPILSHIIVDFRRYRWSDEIDEPEKDGISDHSLDALRYFAVNYKFAPRGKVVAPRVAGM